jgi:hypothetical protein
VVFQPDAQRLASVSSIDQTVKVWDAPRPTLPRTDQWKVIFADDFNRDTLGQRWVPLSRRWSLEKGALRGELHPFSYLKMSFITASIEPRLKLPATVEISFDCWTPDELNQQTYLHSKNRLRGLVASLLGVSQHLKTKGASLLWQASAITFPTLSLNPRFEFKPGKRYRVRILRQPGRFSLFVDGAEVVSTAVPDQEAQGLELQGISGKVGSAIFFDNVQIRAPAGPSR